MVGRGAEGLNGTGLRVEVPGATPNSTKAWGSRIPEEVQVGEQTGIWVHWWWLGEGP